MNCAGGYQRLLRESSVAPVGGEFKVGSMDRMYGSSSVATIAPSTMQEGVVRNGAAVGGDPNVFVFSAYNCLGPSYELSGVMRRLLLRRVDLVFHQRLISTGRQGLRNGEGMHTVQRPITRWRHY